jgi:hypothetical protein
LPESKALPTADDFAAMFPVPVLDSLLEQTDPQKEMLAALKAIAAALTAQVDEHRKLAARVVDLELQARSRTGLPGRPGSFEHVVKPEVLRRHEDGESEPTAAAEGRALSLWMQQAHPQLHQITPHSIRTKIGQDPELRKLFDWAPQDSVGGAKGKTRGRNK